MSVPHVSLSGKKKNSLHKAVSEPALSPNFAETGEANPHLRVFVAHFDGTQNDYKDVPAEFQETLVASSFRSMIDNDVLANRYYHGVGTRTDGFIGMVQSAFGMGCEERAEKAYIELAEATREWRLKDPLAQVHVHVVGFSRGSAIGVHFMNLVHERGITSPKTSRFGGGKHLPQSDLVAPGSVLMSAALLDTVATGQTDVLKLGLPPTAVSVLHLTAGGEQRFLFPLTSLADASRPTEIAQAHGVRMPGGSNVDSDVGPCGPITYRRLHQVMLQGACHSDVGGSYKDGGIREVSGYLMAEFQSSLGLPVKGQRPSFEHVQDAFAHDSRYLIDKLAPQRHYNKGTRRIVEPGAITHWDGRVSETVTMESRLKGAKLHSSEVRLLDLPEESDTYFSYPEQLGKEYKLTVRLADAGKGETGKMMFESIPRGVFSRHSASRRFMFFGKPLQSAPTAEAIIARLEAGEKAFSLTVRLEKAIVRHRVDQVLGITSPDRLPEAAADADAWSSEIRAAIMRMNGEPKKLVQGDVDQIMAKCLESTAAHLLRSRGVSAVSFVPLALGTKTHRIEVKCEATAGPNTLSAESEARHHARLAAAQRGLACLTKLIIETGLNPYSAADRAIRREASPGLAQIEIQSPFHDVRVDDYSEESLWARIKESGRPPAPTASPLLRPSLLSSVAAASAPADQSPAARKVDRRTRM